MESLRNMEAESRSGSRETIVSQGLTRSSDEGCQRGGKDDRPSISWADDIVGSDCGSRTSGAVPCSVPSSGTLCSVSAPAKTCTAPRKRRPTLPSLRRLPDL
ncbi:hypothetical protein DIPPA_10746 [Diplonema papillatum]|nr:hypothetical protein DIPPA_10746 [Diplonema papillatum]